MFYDDTWVIKYLPKFKWHNLTEKLYYDQKVREQRMKQETSQAKKEITFFMEKSDLSKKIKKIEESKEKRLMKMNAKAEQEEGDDIEEGADELPHEKKKRKNLEKMMKYNQRKRREFKQRTPVLVN